MNARGIQNLIKTSNTLKGNKVKTRGVHSLTKTKHSTELWLKPEEFKNWQNNVKTLPVNILKGNKDRKRKTQIFDKKTCNPYQSCCQLGEQQ